MARAELIYDCTEKNADLYYATGFLCPDSFIYFSCGGRSFMVMSDLEIDRAKNEAKVDEVLSLAKYSKLARERGGKGGVSDVIHEIFAERGVTDVVAPVQTSFAIVDALRGHGYHVEAGTEPFYEARYCKRSDELKYIAISQRAVYGAMGLARDVLKKGKIKGNRIIYKGAALTSESLRSMIDIYLHERGYLATGTIVAGGLDGIDPHAVGSGLLRPNESIIVDIFPKSLKTLYFGDATRTFCKGRASEALKKLYATVKEGQKLGLEMVKAGISGRVIHEAIHAFFKSKGYETGERDGRMQGFIHGTGHSIGLEIHEEPLRINSGDHLLKVGNVMSVEPGLYYKDIGGVRIEDLIHVTEKGCEIIGKFPKQLEIL